MTQDEIMEMARQARWSGIYTQWAEPTGEADWSPFKVSLTVPVTMEQIEAFVKLVAAKALAQRTWVGLASEDRLTAKYMQDAPDGIEAVIDYIEAKLKQKNGYAEENT
jgi:hypothetical protein